MRLWIFILTSFNPKISRWIWVRLSNFWRVSICWICRFHFWSNQNSVDIFWILTKLLFHDRISHHCDIYIALNNIYKVSVKIFSPHPENKKIYIISPCIARVDQKYETFWTFLYRHLWIKMAVPSLKCTSIHLGTVYKPSRQVRGGGLLKSLLSLLRAI